MSQSSTEYKVAIVAQLLGRGQSQAQICETLAQHLGLGLDKSFTSGYVSKLVKRAEASGLVERTFRVHRDLIPEKFRIDESYDDLAAELRTRYTGSLRHVRVSKFDFDAMREEAFRDDVNYLLEFLKHTQFVGLAPGHTIAALLKHLNDFRISDHQKTTARFFPLSADIYNLFETNANISTDIGIYNASLLAKRLTRLISDQDPDLVPDLTNIPSYRDLPEAVYEEVLNVSRNYTQVFGDRGFIHHMDTMVCSLSRYKRPFGLTEQETKAFLKKAKIDVSFDNIVGDMAGAILVKNTPTVLTEAKKFRDYEKKSNNITYDQIRALAHRAAAPNAKINGTIVIATGIQKAQVLKKALEQKIINVLLCDYRLAEAVLA